MIKVNRLVTHVFRFNERSLKTWEKFTALMKPMDKVVGFYLFQLPPSMKPSFNQIQRIENFNSVSGLGERFALEFRHPDWFEKRWVDWAEMLDATLVSPDS